jgi:signal peptidase I
VLAIWCATLVRRLHDAGSSGYWALLVPVPLLGVLAVLVILLLPPRAPPRPHPVARKIGALGLMALVLVFVTKPFLWNPYVVPSESMKPTLLAGDYVIATKVSPATLQRGDVLVFRHPVNGQDYLARLIGLPGETVQLRGGVVFINDLPAPQVPDGVFDEVFGPVGPLGFRPRCGNAPVADGDPCRTDRLIEALPEGQSHAILDIGAMDFLDDTDLFTLPPGMLFFLGDHRDNSADSRFSKAAGGMGFVPVENVHHRLRWVLFSSTGPLSDPRLWRLDRFLKGVE